MKLTTKSEYSILAMIYLARHSVDRYIKIEDICSEYDISKKYLQTLITTLKQSRYISTKRGANGGYKLAKPAEDISLAEIIRLMDGPLAPVDSVSEYYYSETPLMKEKKVLNEFREIRDYIAGKMERLTLADLI